MTRGVLPRGGWCAALLFTSLVMSLGLNACTRRPSDTIARVVGASERRGPWVPPSGYEFFVRAELHLERGEFQQAVEAYEMARSGLDDPYVIAREAEAAMHVPNLALAASLLDEGLRTTPDSEALLLARARLAVHAGDLALQETSLREASRVAPDSTESLFALTSFLDAHGAAEEAITLLDRFVSTHGHREDSSLGRARLVSVLRAQLARAVLTHDAARGARVAQELVRLSPVHRPEILRFVAQAAAESEPLLAHAVLRALPVERAELALRFAVAQSASDRAAAEHIALAYDDGTPLGSLESARCWLALGDAARAEETASGVWLATQETHARDLVLRARIAQGDLRGALTLLEETPPTEGRSALCDALRLAALPSLALEVCPAPTAVEAH